MEMAMVRPSVSKHLYACQLSLPGQSACAATEVVWQPVALNLNSRILPLGCVFVNIFIYI
jgi:hypothetical protein